MNSLKAKLIGAIALIVVGIISAAVFINYEVQKGMMNSIANSNAVVLSETIRSAITNAMRSGHSEEVTSILARIKGQEQIRALRIVDLSGQILNSGTATEIGQRVHDDDVDLLQRVGRQRSAYLTHQNAELVGALSVLHNGPDCFGCHDRKQAILGVLEVEYSLKSLNGLLEKSREVSFVSVLIIVFLIVVFISIFLTTYVDRPIRKLIHSMERVEHGDFEARTVITSSYEMNNLSEKFNLMVDRVRDLVDTTVSHERELARAQEKLAHHSEVEVMNRRLEEQLKEIEYLNISLEERIEDVEEANYKIADLAGELEDRNTNLVKAVGRLTTLHEVGLAINSIMDIDRLFTHIVRKTVETLEGQIGYIILIDPADGKMRVNTIVGWDEKPGAVIPLKSSSVSGWVVENCRPLLVADINDAPQFDRFSALGYERKTLVCAPLVVKDEIIGTITVVNKVNNTTYTPDELELISTIAAQASVAIKNAQLYEEQQKIYLNTIHALVSAIEASDSYTRGHSERVTHYSVKMAQKLGLPADRLKIIERAAVLHDIGKIGIDLNLLHKQGKLTPEDIRDLQQHPEIGMKILEPIEFLQDVRLCIGQHHERYDGHGYPNKLGGDDLLLEARILAIADSFDAMTSDRPYRQGLPVETAVQELIEHAGTQFDPELVPHFIELLEKDDLIRFAPSARRAGSAA